MGVKRETLARVARQAQMSTARATVREFDDEHLLQEIKYADVYHSETPSQFERFQPVGITSVPLKQDEEQNQKQYKGKQKPSQGSGEQGDWNHDQPKGKAAEAVMMYIGGTRAHPIAVLVDDRRTRPYQMKPGRAAFYSPDGSEVMGYIKQDGLYLVSLDGPSHDNQQSQTRMASLRHVNKPMQSHKIEQGESQGGGQSLGAAATQQQEYKHEGASVNTEVRCIKDRIEFRTGDKVVGYYEVSSDTWHFNGKIIDHQASEKTTESAPTITKVASARTETVGPTFLGLKAPGSSAPLVETVAEDIPAMQTFAARQRGTTYSPLNLLGTKATSLINGLGGLTTGLGGLGTNLSTVADGLNFSNLAGNLTSIAGNLGGLSSLTGIVGNVGNLGSLLNGVSGLDGMLAGLPNGLNAMMSGMGGLSSGLLGAAAGQIGGLSNGLSGFINGVGGFSGGIGGLVTSVNGMVQGVTMQLGQVQLMPQLQNIITNLQGVSSGLRGIISGSGLSDVTIDFSNIADDLSELTDPGQESLFNLAPIFAAIADSNLTDLVDGLTNCADDLDVLIDELDHKYHPAGAQLVLSRTAPPLLRFYPAKRDLQLSKFAPQVFGY